MQSHPLRWTHFGQYQEDLCMCIGGTVTAKYELLVIIWYAQKHWSSWEYLS